MSRSVMTMSMTVFNILSKVIKRDALRTESWGVSSLSKIHAVPLELKEANEFVNQLHRHHDPVYRDKFRVGAWKDGKLVGVV